MSIIRANKIAMVLSIATALLVSAHPASPKHTPTTSLTGAIPAPTAPTTGATSLPISPPAKPASISLRSISWTPPQPTSHPSISITNSPR